MQISKTIRSWSYGLGRLSSKVAVAFFLTVTASQAAQITLVALGDSLTQGYGLAQQDGFVPVLESWLNDQGLDVSVKNAGVSGDTTAGGLERADWSLSGDVDGVILALGGNDMLRGFPPEMVYQNLAGIIEIAQTKGISVFLIGLKASLNYGQSYKDSFDDVYPRLAKTYETAFYDNFIGALVNGRSMAEVQTYLQRDGIHPNAKGVRLIVQDMGPKIAEWIGTLPEH